MQRHESEYHSLFRNSRGSENYFLKCDNSLKGLRNQALLRLGYETMRRRSELCAFKFEDIYYMEHFRIVLKNLMGDHLTNWARATNYYKAGTFENSLQSVIFGNNVFIKKLGFTVY